MPFHATAHFVFTAGGGAAFIAKFAEDDGYSVTKGAEGMIDFKMFTSVEAPDTVIVWYVTYAKTDHSVWGAFARTSVLW